ncbi:MAG: alpha/beta fold hydrolase [Desulfobaccales bacterium]
MVLVSEAALTTEEFKSIDSRPEVIQSYYLIFQGRRLPKTVMLLIPGGNGYGHIKAGPGGEITLSKNFLVRTAGKYAEAGFAAAIMDIPSDATWGRSDKYHQEDQHVESDRYRFSDEQLEDYKAVIENLASRGAQRFFLCATSRGGLSGVSLASKMEDPRLKGLILTASIQYTDYLCRSYISKICIPVLMIHHRQDACELNSYPEALLTAMQLGKFTEVTFCGVSGGPQGGLPRESDPCMPLSHHGFYGIEDQVTSIITKWAHFKEE